jgi:hypothetical protein
MQDRLKELVAGLGALEQDLVEKKYLEKIMLWARLLDEVEAGLPYIEDISHSRENLNQCKQQFEHILNSLNGLDIAQDANRVTQIDQYVSGYRQYFNILVELKQKLQAVTEDRTDLNALKRVNAEAKRRKAELEKSFSDYSQKQAENSTRTLAKYFDLRLKELKSDKNQLTNPEAWARKRAIWLTVLIVAIVVLGGAYFLLMSYDAIKGYEWQFLAIKLTVLAVLYLQYHFATKNYHIYADLVARYEHLSVISKTMTDFSAAAYEDEILRESVLSNASKTLFADINTGHQKSAEKEASIFENVINQIPKNSN